MPKRGQIGGCEEAAPLCLTEEVDYVFSQTETNYLFPDEENNTRRGVFSRS